MNNKVNDILEEFDSLSLEEQETVLDIEKKRLIEKKGKLLVNEVKEAEREYESGKLKPKSVEEITNDMDNVKAIDSVIELLNKLPEDSNYEDIIAEIYFKKQVEEGLQQLDNGEYLSHDEVIKKIEKWLK